MPRRIVSCHRNEVSCVGAVQWVRFVDAVLQSDAGVV